MGNISLPTRFSMGRTFTLTPSVDRAPGRGTCVEWSSLGKELVNALERETGSINTLHLYFIGQMINVD